MSEKNQVYVSAGLTQIALLIKDPSFKNLTWLILLSNAMNTVTNHLEFLEVKICYEEHAIMIWTPSWHFIPLVEDFWQVMFNREEKKFIIKAENGDNWL